MTSVFMPVNIALSQQYNSDGIYVGLDGSYDQIRDNIKATPDNIYNANGTAFGIFVGYRGSQDKFTVAVEARYGYSFISNDIITTNPTQRYSITHEFGGAIMPGFWLSEQALIYAKVGFNQSTQIKTLQDIEFKSSNSGISLGGGIQLYATDTVAIRAEYERSNLKGIVPIVYNASTYNDWKVRRNRFRVALITAF